MYYEIFEEIKYADESNKEIDSLKLVNKSFLDSFYEVRSEINPIYKESDDYNRIVGLNYSYLFYQKMVSGIAKSVFIGLDPWSVGEKIFLPSGRLKVPGKSLRIDSRKPILYFHGDVFSYENCSLKRWEDELIGSSENLNKKLNLSITREGFRAHINRILEIIYSMSSSAKKRRTNWTIFLHELIILQKTFSSDELSQLGFVVKKDDGFLKVLDYNFSTRDYLEFKLMADLGMIKTDSIHVPELTGTSIEKYSQLNAAVLGKIPLCHFYINEHMFVGKEEFTLDQYTEYFVHPWTKSSNVRITFLENETNKMMEKSLSDFKAKLQEMKYSIICGFHEVSGGQNLHFTSEPKMVKD